MAGRLKHELRATWLGGMRVLARIERADFDVVARRPRLGAAVLFSRSRAEHVEGEPC